MRREGGERCDKRGEGGAIEWGERGGERWYRGKRRETGNSRDTVERREKGA